MFFLIKHLGSLVKEKSMDSIVACLFLVIRVNAASGNDNDVRSFSYEEIIINDIINVSMGNAGGYIYGLALCAGFDVYIKSGKILL